MRIIDYEHIHIILSKKMDSQSVFPVYQESPNAPECILSIYHVISTCEQALVPETFKEKFIKDGKVTVHQGLKQTHFLNAKNAAKCTLSTDSFVIFSESISSLEDYHGIASDILACHKFSRKSQKTTPVRVYVKEGTKDWNQIRLLTEAKNRAVELGNGRGDVEGTPAYFERISREFAEKYKVGISVLRGDELLENGFRLMHAVGRASVNEPIFVNLKYQGDKDSSDWVAFIGKGVVFDAGGLNIKNTPGMKDMFLDKCGAVAVLSAFQAIVEEGLKVNLTISMGFVENFIDAKSYRPSDIIKSRKGLNVEIGNTDAEGRLVLADCMDWTQEVYPNTKVMIELSTLTGSVIYALGHRYAGAFTNNENLVSDLKKAGLESHELVWHLPHEGYDTDLLVKHKFADITSASGSSQAPSAYAAACFLQTFVNPGVSWIHLDIAGVAMVPTEGTGFGARLLVQYLRNYSRMCDK